MKDRTTGGINLFWFSILLLLLLSALFFKSFSPDLVHFGNDDPLAQAQSAYSRIPQAFFGQWTDLNSLGLNGGVAPPDLTSLVRWAIGPIGFAKFIIPISLWFLGFAAFFFFVRSGLGKMGAALGALAATLTTGFFSNACWGSVAPILGFGFTFLALGAVAKKDGNWISAALAGIAIGFNVMEGADVGALFSLLAAAYIIYRGTTEGRLRKAFVDTCIVAAFAAFLAANTVVQMVATNVSNISGTKQDEQTRSAHWDFATQWSLPKSETLSLIVPNLFGCRINTPGAATYWGAIGRDPAWDNYLASDKTGPRPPDSAFLRYTGRGIYLGTFVAILVLWTALQSLRKQHSVFNPAERKLIWFWCTAVVVCLLLAWGRHAPFYALIYRLPWLSTVRNPDKFLHVLTFAVVVLFGYGVHGLNKRYLCGTVGSKFSAFETYWVSGCALAILLSLSAWAVYASSRAGLEQYIQHVGFGKDAAHEIAGFSISQVGWFIAFLIASSVFMLATFDGWFSGRAFRAAVLMGVILSADLIRADVPYISFWNYKQKYETDAQEPIIKFLMSHPYDRVGYILQPPLATPPQFAEFQALYGIEWIQQLFPYYNILSPDIVQMPRTPDDLMAFRNAMQVGLKKDWNGNTILDEKTLYRNGRHWQLTATRYLVGPAALIDALNQVFDTVPNRFRIVQRFYLGPRPGVTAPEQLSDIAAIPTDDTNAPYALFEFTGTLARATLFTDWKVEPDPSALEEMASPSFDAAKTVLLPHAPAASGQVTTNSRTVHIISYTPSDIMLEAVSTAPAVLMLADKYDPDWHVWVDGKESDVLRCDYLMRGVYLAPGQHIVEFRFRPSLKLLYVYLAAVAVGICLLLYAFVAARNKRDG